MTKTVFLEIDGKKIPLNPFVQKIFTQVIKGMVASLDDIPEDPKTLTITVKEAAD